MEGIHALAGGGTLIVSASRRITGNTTTLNKVERFPRMSATPHF
jgi:hypothetical protein